MGETLEALQPARGLRARQRIWAGFMRALARLEVWFDKLLWGARRRFGRLGPVQVVAYRGYGTTEQALVRGRVLEASVLERSLPDDTAFRSFRRMLRRFFSKEVPETAVQAELSEGLVSGVTDDEGYFELPVIAPLLRGAGDWKTTDVRAVRSPVRGLVPVHATAEVLIPGPSAELCIISDIDDTVLQTHVTQKLKMIWVTLSGNAYTRMPFEGTSELYRALVAGASGHANNPVFYVSKSPWNLYDFLVDFLELHELPRGPLLLRDIGLREAPSIDHKTAAVWQLLESYPKLPFVLLGDSGERDPEIYLETAVRYPGRVAAIYIRDLNAAKGGGDTDSRERLRERAKACGTDMLWMAHARDALAHARGRGLVK